MVKTPVYIGGGDGLTEGEFQWFDGSPINITEKKFHNGRCR
jgi:hypothetical protein